MHKQFRDSNIYVLVQILLYLSLSLIVAVCLMKWELMNHVELTESVYRNCLIKGFVFGLISILNSMVLYFAGKSKSTLSEGNRSANQL